MRTRNNSVFGHFSRNVESYCLHLYKKNYRKLDFWVFPKQLLFRRVLKDLKWMLLQKQLMFLSLLIIFLKSPILVVWLGSEFASALLPNCLLNSFIAMNLFLWKSVTNHWYKERIQRNLIIVNNNKTRLCNEPFRS